MLPDRFASGNGPQKNCRYKPAALEKQRRYSPRELGARAGISGKYIGMIEREERSPTVDVVAKLVIALGAEPQDLFAAADQRISSWAKSQGVKQLLVAALRASLPIAHIVELHFDLRGPTHWDEKAPS